MVPNGITHQLVQNDQEGAEAIVKWLSFVPRDALMIWIIFGVKCNMLIGDINCLQKDLVDWCFFTSCAFVSGMICQSEFDIHIYVYIYTYVYIHMTYVYIYINIYINIYIYIDFDYGHASERYRAIVRTVK